MYEEGVEARTAISAEEYADKRQGTTVNHFYEKLLHLADRMVGHWRCVCTVRSMVY